MISLAWARLYGAVYRGLYWYREHYEEIEPWIITVELALILSGLWFVLTEIRETPSGTRLSLNFAMHHFQDFVEFLIFIALGISALSRMLIALRGFRLGYRFTQLGPPGDLNMNDLFNQVRGAPWGDAPGVGQSVSALLVYADEIARQTSTLLSVRTFYFRDREWLVRERDSLGEWFQAFPGALWRLSASDQHKSQSTEKKGRYYSVIVPITGASARSIRRGQKATDLAEVEREVSVGFGSKIPVGPALGHLDLLAYLQLHVPASKKEKLEEELLFAASIQHLAYFLHGLYGSKTDFRTAWNFAILCEAANSRHGMLLERLGFVQLSQNAHEKSDGPVRPGRSYAGFPLFELQVVGGQAFGDCEGADAASFLYLIEEFVTHWGQQVKEPVAAMKA